MSREQWAGTRPGLTLENEMVLKVWRFCGGWNPDRLPMASAYYGIEDVDTMIGQLIAIDEAITAHRAAQKG